MKINNQDSLTIFSVSLSENTSTIKETLNRFKTLHYNFKYFVITPDKDTHIVNTALENYKNVYVISEEAILPYNQFEGIIRQITKSNRISCNPHWYYQQILKIIFALEGYKHSNHFSYPVVMFDADSIPIKKIKFFTPTGQIIHYRSLLEHHRDYFAPLKKIFNADISIKSGYTVQFFACTDRLANVIKSKIPEYLGDAHQSEISKSIATLVIKSVYECFGELSTSKFSEQEFFGYASATLHKNKAQTPVLSFRPWQLDAPLSKSQIFILRIFQYSLLTYEKRGTYCKKNITYKKFFLLLISDIYFQFKNYLKK